MKPVCSFVEGWGRHPVSDNLQMKPVYSVIEWWGRQLVWALDGVLGRKHQIHLQETRWPDEAAEAEVAEGTREPKQSERGGHAMSSLVIFANCR